MGMSPFVIICRKVPHHLLDLSKLSIGEKFRNTASVMAEQILDVQEEVRLKLEKSNVKYKEAADKKRREKIFCEGDIVMVYLQRGRIPGGAYNKLKQKKYGPLRLWRRLVITFILWIFQTI